MKFGAHVSIAGGIFNAPINASAIGCEIFQMFTRSPQGGPAPKLTQEIVKQFRENCDKEKQEAWYVHAPYFVNFASGNPRIRHGSVTIIREELERASLIGARALMSHMGSAKDVGSEDDALKIVIEGVQKVLDGYKGSAKFLVEISAGAGMVIGDTFEDLAKIVHATKGKAGVCFDTQHAFGSGYDLRTKMSVANVAKEFAEKVGWEHLYASHCNDSMVPLGSHKDRHEHIGKGELGLEGFKAILGNTHFAKLDFLCETPYEGADDDIAVLKKLRGILKK